LRPQKAIARSALAKPLRRHRNLSINEPVRFHCCISGPKTSDVDSFSAPDSANDPGHAWRQPLHDLRLDLTDGRHPLAEGESDSVFENMQLQEKFPKSLNGEQWAMESISHRARRAKDQGRECFELVVEALHRVEPLDNCPDHDRG
jgi:hypothetical protein